MGWEIEGFGVTVCLDAHAGDQERQDAELWAELRGRLLAILREDRYAPILVTDVYDYDDDGS